MKSPFFLLYPAIFALFLSLAAGCDEDATKPAAITLERTECFGACPFYTVSLEEDGSVTFIGRRFVKVVDTVRSAIAPAAVTALAQKFDNASFFSLQDRYVPGENCPNPATDLPGQTLTFARSGMKKSVTIYWGCNVSESVQQTLTQLGDAVDSVAQTKQWIE